MKSRLFRLEATFLAAALMVPMIVRAQSKSDPANQGNEGITRRQADEILNELKKIRELLEKMGLAPARAEAPPTPSTVKVSAVGYALGSADAPLTLVEFSDYQCPFCAQFQSQTFPEFKKNYIDTGKVRFISQDLPLDFHTNAMGAARAARCAGEQGKFWEMRNVLINNAKDLASESVVKYAQGVGLEMGAFRTCLDSEKYKAEIQRDVTDASSLGITGTPTFVLGRTAPDKIEGTRFVGVQPLAFFEARINELLPK